MVAEAASRVFGVRPRVELVQGTLPDGALSIARDEENARNAERLRREEDLRAHPRPRAVRGPGGEGDPGEARRRPDLTRVRSRARTFGVSRAMTRSTAARLVRLRASTRCRSRDGVVVGEGEHAAVAEEVLARSSHWRRSNFDDLEQRVGAVGVEAGEHEAERAEPGEVAAREACGAPRRRWGSARGRGERRRRGRWRGRGRACRRRTAPPCRA